MDEGQLAEPVWELVIRRTSRLVWLVGWTEELLLSLPQGTFPDFSVVLLSAIFFVDIKRRMAHIPHWK